MAQENVKDLRLHLRELARQGNTNETNIATNTGNISTNTGNISTNTTNIANIQTEIDKLPDLDNAFLLDKFHWPTIANNSTDSDHDIDFGPGAAADSTGLDVIRVNSTLVKRLDAAWTAGTNQGGLFTGTVAADTTYHCFVIKHTDGTVDAGFDTSISAANAPVGYTLNRRLWSFKTDSGANLRQMTIVGDLGYYDTAILDVNVVNLGSSGILYTLSIPNDIRPVTLMNAAADGVESFNIVVSSPDQADVAPGSLGTAPHSSLHGTNARYQSHFRVRANASGQIRARSNTANVTNFGVVTIGYIDHRFL